MPNPGSSLNSQGHSGRLNTGGMSIPYWFSARLLALAYASLFLRPGAANAPTKRTIKTTVDCVCLIMNLIVRFIYCKKGSNSFYTADVTKFSFKIIVT